MGDCDGQRKGRCGEPQLGPRSAGRPPARVRPRPLSRLVRDPQRPHARPPFPGCCRASVCRGGLGGREKNRRTGRGSVTSGCCRSLATSTVARSRPISLVGSGRAGDAFLVTKYRRQLPTPLASTKSIGSCANRRWYSKPTDTRVRVSSANSAVDIVHYRRHCEWGLTCPLGPTR